MRSLTRLAAVLGSLLGSVAISAQTGTVPPLQRIIDKPYRVLAKATACGGSPTSPWLIGAKTGVLTGVERLPGQCEPDADGNRETVDLQGMTLQAALDKLVEIDPRYSWQMRDGVIVMRPVEAWSNPNNPLNQVIEGFTMQDRNYRGALDLFRVALFREPPSTKPDYEGRGQQVRRKFSMTAPSGPAVDALDSISRSHGGLTWYVSYKTAVASVDEMVVQLYTFDDEGTLTQRHTPQW